MQDIGDMGTSDTCFSVVKIYKEWQSWLFGYIQNYIMMQEQGLECVKFQVVGERLLKIVQERLPESPRFFKVCNGESLHS